VIKTRQLLSERESQSAMIICRVCARRFFQFPASLQHFKLVFVHSGVPQDDVLGPLLFPLYINDLPDAVSDGSTTRLFADDCAISDDYLPSMCKAVLSISGNVYKQQEMEIGKLIYDV
jgi:hypothetical protein